LNDDALTDVKRRLRARPARWLVTGSAGFIGSHLAQALLALDQHVVGIDNFATGFRRNVDDVQAAVGPARAARYRFIEADIVELDACQHGCESVDFVLHQAALGSVPRSIDDPLRTHATNATGFLNMLVAARDARVRRFVYAASSATYGDHAALPKVEEVIGAPLSPYAVTKRVDELYAQVFTRCYDIETIGLRYFNVFGPRQDPSGAYAAVVPRFVSAMLTGTPVTIYGDGETSRDFCYVDNVVAANLLAATTVEASAVGQIFNVAAGARTSLNELHRMLNELIAERRPTLSFPPPIHAAFRAGDVRHSEADIGKARRLLGYAPLHDVRTGLRDALPWYERHLQGM
jgi:UDP-N-acetylglucosamine 4-epimerase